MRMTTANDLISTLRQGRPVTARMAKQIIASLEKGTRAEQGLLHMCGLYQREISMRKDKVIFTREECEMVEAALNKLASLESGGAYGRDDLMALAAVRYCLGRSSYIVSDCADWLATAWPHIGPGTRKTIQRDVEEAFARDDADRAEGREHKALGWDCDRAQWERVRQLWEEVGR